ncbi:hypothetical protein ECANGB1_2729 [Enterospora canceri]|uniref:Uncharacterized protein n=1 Tax=Enterospora canceri TaxID=1081671 RepID=A0A1Y1S5D4_9MICR|nr:hypothetical protein ECANGB1_2729 [Enterospora canceri]
MQHFLSSIIALIKLGTFFLAESTRNSKFFSSIAL